MHKEPLYSTGGDKHVGYYKDYPALGKRNYAKIDPYESNEVTENIKKKLRVKEVHNHDFQKGLKPFDLIAEIVDKMERVIEDK